MCVCLLLFLNMHDRETEQELFLAFKVLLHCPLEKLIFVGVCCNSFNCVTPLISSLLTTNSGCSSTLFLMPSLFLSSSHAVRLWGCQRRNKVTGWWARHPKSDHMDWCCARHHGGWLAQQGSSHNTGTYCRLFPHPPSTHDLLRISVYFCHFDLLDALFLHPSVFVSSQSLHLQTFVCCFFLHYVEVKAACLQSTLSIYYVIIVWVRW